MKTGKRFLAFVLSLGCIGGLTACDMGNIEEMFGGDSAEQSSSIENASGVESTEDNEASDSTGADNSSSGVVTEMPEVKGEHVAKSQWDAAFEYLRSAEANVTVTESIADFYPESNVRGFPAHWEMSYFNAKYEDGRIWQSSYRPQSYLSDELYYENYYERIGSTGDVYQDFLAWRRDGKDAEWWVGSWQDLNSRPLSPDLKLDYDVLTFDAEQGCYVGTKVQMLAGTFYQYEADVRITFVDGKLYRYELTREDNGLSVRTKWFTDYGTTTVERYVNSEEL